MTTRFTMTVESGDAALTEDPHGEMRRLLLEVANQLDDYRDMGDLSGTCYDANGNRVGDWSFTAGEDDA